MFLNWPPDLRALLASIWLFGIMPPKVKDYQQMLLPVVEQFAKYQPGPQGEDLRVWDADTKTDLDGRLCVACILNDIRAIPCGTCGSHPPCYVGSCNMCKQGGRRADNRTVLGGAVRGVGHGMHHPFFGCRPFLWAPSLFRAVHPFWCAVRLSDVFPYCNLPCSGVEGTKLRAAYAKEFKGDATLRAWATKNAPPLRTKLSSIASGKRVESGASTEKEEAYKSVDLFTRLLWYHDKNNHVLYDNAHQFANVLKQMLNFMKNRTKKDKLLFTQTMRKRELASGHTHPH